MENIKETIDYIYLSIFKNYQKSQLEGICMQYDNTKSDRLLLEIIKQHKNNFKDIAIYCCVPENEKICAEIIGDNADKKIKIVNFDFDNLFKTNYEVSSKNQLYCNSFLKYIYLDDLYPLFNYTNEEIEEMLKFYNINIDELEEEKYGLTIEELVQLGNYLYCYNKFEENLNKKEKSAIKVFNFIKQQKALKTKFIPSLTQLQEMESFL